MRYNMMNQGGERLAYPTGGVTTMQIDPSVAVDSVGFSGKMAPEGMPLPEYYNQDEALSVEDRVYQKYSDHRLVVKDVSIYMRTLKEYLLSIEGRIISSSTNVDAAFSSGYLTARVPVAKFEEATGRVTEGVKKVMGESISAQDRTGDVVRVDETLLKLQDQKAVKEAELADAIKNQATSATQLRIKQQIDSLQRQIESVQKQGEGVQEDVEYATMTISVADSEKYFLGGEYQPTPWEAFLEAIRSLGGSASTLVRALIWVIVYSVLWLPVVLLWRWVSGKFSQPKTV